MLKKTMLLISVVLVVAAYVGPPSASAVEWQDEGNAVSGNPHLHQTGTLCWNAGTPPNNAGYCSTFHITVEMNGGTDKGKVKSFALTNCLGTGLLKNLKCTNTPTAQWEVTAEATRSRIKSLVLVNHYYSPLDPTHKTILTSTTTTGDYLLWLNNEAEMSSVTVEGSGAAINGVPATVTGTLEVSPAGTYGIG